MRTLTLPLKAIYFHQIKAGEKTEEYRLCTPYWAKRLKSPFGIYDQIVLTLGYPKADDTERRLVRPWRGFTIKTIQHPHFGPHPVTVYAINVAAPDPAEPTRCAAGKDGDCIHKQCPQLRDGEPHKTRRHCPLDKLEKTA